MKGGMREVKKEKDCAIKRKTTAHLLIHIKEVEEEEI